MSMRVTSLLPFDPDDVVGDLEGRTLLGPCCDACRLDPWPERRRWPHLPPRRSGPGPADRPGYLPHCPRRSAGPASAGTGEAGAGTAAPRWPAAGCRADWRRGRPTGSPRPGTVEEARRLVAPASHVDETA